MFEKVKTKGDGQSPVYAFLTAKYPAPKWNFHKYVVGKDGQVRAGFASGVTPESKELKDAIEAALKD
jgi:glutathione peroxidase